MELINSLKNRKNSCGKCCLKNSRLEDGKSKIIIESFQKEIYFSLWIEKFATSFRISCQAARFWVLHSCFFSGAGVASFVPFDLHLDRIRLKWKLEWKRVIFKHESKLKMRLLRLWILLRFQQHQLETWFNHLHRQKLNRFDLKHVFSSIRTVVLS